MNYITEIVQERFIMVKNNKPINYKCVQFLSFKGSWWIKNSKEMGLVSNIYNKVVSLR